MKNRCFYLLILVAFTCMTACTPRQLGPSQSVEAYMEKLVSGDVDSFVEGIRLDAIADSTMEQDRSEWVAMLTEIVLKEFESAGGVQSVEVENEVISADGIRAQVDVILHYKNGETVEQPVNLILIDGKWLMDLSF